MKKKDFKFSLFRLNNYTLLIIFLTSIFALPIVINDAQGLYSEETSKNTNNDSILSKEDIINILNDSIKVDHVAIKEATETIMTCLSKIKELQDKLAGIIVVALVNFATTNMASTSAKEMIAETIISALSKAQMLVEIANNSEKK